MLFFEAPVREEAELPHFFSFFIDVEEKKIQFAD